MKCEICGEMDHNANWHAKFLHTHTFVVERFYIHCTGMGCGKYCRTPRTWMLRPPNVVFVKQVPGP